MNEFMMRKLEFILLLGKMIGDYEWWILCIFDVHFYKVVDFEELILSSKVDCINLGCVFGPGH